MPNNLYLGNCLEVMRTLPDDSVDACVTDPPYGLSFMGKRWDYDVPGVEIWREVLRVLKPGGLLLSFGGTRTYHRMVVNIEDAGFEIRDQIQWIYGSGFPKSLDVSKAIDKVAKQEGEYGEPKSAAHAGWIERGRMRADEGHEGYQRPWMQNVEAVDRNARQYLPATDAAKQWEGWGTALKPANEPIVMARKPFKGTVAENVQTWGTGALNIDGCRVQYQSDSDRNRAIASSSENSECEINGSHRWGYIPVKRTGGGSSGRFPTNVIHDGSDEVLAGFPQSKTGNINAGIYKDKESESVARGRFAGWNNKRHQGDSGSAARFFYCAKASKSDRNEGLESNHHPTVKPTELMRYLCRLITPPNGTVLDPFMGSGSTGVACILENCNFIGIEKDMNYFTIAKQRINSRVQQPGLFDIPRHEIETDYFEMEETDLF